MTSRRRHNRLPVTAAALAAMVAAGAAAAAPGPELGEFDGRPENVVWQDLVRLAKVPAAFDGRGVTVALIDTGVSESPDLDGRVLARVDLTEERDGLDRFGHGTHMAGLIAGTGAASGGRWVGAAPGASLVSVKVAGWNGAADATSVIAGLRWVVSNRERFGIRIVNLSYGTDGVQPAATDPLNRAVQRATEAGLLVVVSSGNRGPGTLAKPADDPGVLTVGAFDDGNTLLSLDDAVPDFSGRAADGTRPDLVAPGVSIVSLRAPDSVADAFRPAARVGDAYFKGTGTSQSAAIVSGVAARVLSADPTLGPAELKALLVQTANDNLQGQPGAGAGAVNARDAVRAVLRNEPIELLPEAAAGNGTGTIEGSRGTQHVFADLDGDGAPEPVAGEVDALGGPWRAAEVTERWTPFTWALSPWAAVTTETPGFASTPPGPAGWPGAAPDADSWAARNWSAAGWNARNWSARNWSARNWS